MGRNGCGSPASACLSLTWSLLLWLLDQLSIGKLSSPFSSALLLQSPHGLSVASSREASRPVPPPTPRLWPIPIPVPSGNRCGGGGVWRFPHQLWSSWCCSLKGTGLCFLPFWPLEPRQDRVEPGQSHRGEQGVPPSWKSGDRVGHPQPLCRCPGAATTKYQKPRGFKQGVVGLPAWRPEVPRKGVGRGFLLEVLRGNLSLAIRGL